MKRTIYIIATIILAALTTTQQAKAQKVDMETGLVVWTGSTVADAIRITNEGGFFYLVEYKSTLDVNDKELYVAARGAYGVQAVMSSVGMRMQLEASQPAVDLGGDQPTTAYQFISRIENADTQSDYLGDRMGFDNEHMTENTAGSSVYLDRSGQRAYWEGNQNNCVNFPNWILNESTETKYNVRYKGEASSHTETIRTYTIQNTDTRRMTNDDWNNPRYEYRATYIRIQDGKLVTTFNANEASKFVIVSEDDFNVAMTQVTWGEVDLGVFVQDATFGRDNKDGIYWVWENAAVDANGKTLDEISLNTNPRHWHQRNQDVMCNGVMLQNRISRALVGHNVAGYGDNVTHDGFRNSYGQYYSAEIYNEVNSLTQTLHGGKIPNLVDGLYKLTAQALYYDDVNGTTNDGVAYFVVKRDVLGDDGVTIVESKTEYMPVTPMNQVSNNITPHSGVSAGYVFNNNENAYVLTTFVEINGKVNLTIGIQQREAVGWTVIGNVHLFAHGKQAMYVDEDWSQSETLKYIEGDVEHTTTGNPYDLARWHDNYDYPSTVYYQRTFTVGAWNPICLPLELTGRQVRQAFGDDAKVCAFQGQHDTQKSLLYFERALDLDKAENMDKTVIEAGVPYIIYVSNTPQHPTGITAEVGNGAYNHTITIEGATYAIPGVLKKQVTAYQTSDGQGGYDLLPPQEVTGGGGFKMVGSFYHTTINKDNVRYDFGGQTLGNKSGNNYWVLTKGNLYHLAGTKNWNIWATYAYIYLPPSASGNAKEFTFAIDDGTGISELTTIEGISIEGAASLNNATDVYTLAGQKVQKGSLEGLKSGIYLVNGRKVMVKN